MTDTIVANVSKMFREIEPAYVSGSQCELGQSAGPITWRNALAIADKAAPDATVYGNDTWLVSDAYDACDLIKSWAHETGAWTDADTDPWGKRECLALFAQIIASELREIYGQDTLCDAAEVIEIQDGTDWNTKGTTPIGQYHLVGSDLFVEYYTGI